MKVAIKNGDARTDKTPTSDLYIRRFRNCRECIVHKGTVANYDFRGLCPRFNMARVAQVTRRWEYSDSNVVTDRDLAPTERMNGLKCSQANTIDSISRHYFVS